MSLLLHGTTRQRLWLGAAAVTLFILSILSVYAALPRSAERQRNVGQDFIAFYTAGTFVREGRSRDLYDLHAIAEYQHGLAHRFGDDLGQAIGPWWNPPFYAWVFVPFAALSYPLALKLWLLTNLLATAGAVTIFCTWLKPRQDLRGPATWMLVPVLVALSTPFLQSLSHAQNTGTSLLILTLIVAAWRSERAVLAGLALGFLSYKPQLAAVVAAILTISLGWRVLVGLAVTAGGLLAINLQTLPGTLHDYHHLLPRNLHFVLFEVRYLWDRHVTLEAFWRLLLQGYSTGESTGLVVGLTLGCVLGLGGALLVAAGWGGLEEGAEGRGEGTEARRHGGTKRGRGEGAEGKGADGGRKHDRLIAATIAATPLLMPFYFDYDQLLLAIPIVLFAAEELQHSVPLIHSSLVRRPSSLLRILLPIWFAWLMINPDVAAKTHINFAVVLLTGIAVIFVIRALHPLRAVRTSANDLPAAPPALAA